MIDMLNDFLHPVGTLCIGDSGELVQSVSSRIAEWRAQGNPIVYIVDRHLPQDAEFDMFPPHCLSGQWGGRILDQLAPHPGDLVVHKRRYSAFFGTDLDLTLRELGVSEVELSGVCTHICVLYTAADARMLNYCVTVHKECVASFDQQAHQFALGEMEKTLGVTILQEHPDEG